MKKCLICGHENEKDAVTCVACGEGTFAEPVVEESVESVESVEDEKPRRGRRS